MAHNVVLEKFNGPLHLLMELIDQKKLTISEVSLAAVADQYVAYVEAEDLPPQELADFLTIAVKLLLLKTRSLLPYLNPVDEDEEVNLEQQLKIYQVYWRAAGDVSRLFTGDKLLFAKTKNQLTDQVIFSPPTKKQLNPQKLESVYEEIIKFLRPLMDLPKQSIKKTVSLAQKMALLKELLSKVARLNFKKFLLGSSNNKTEMIVNFLAVLELIKQNHLTIIYEADNDIILARI